MTDVEIIGILKTYVQAILVGMGALKGANCTIQSIATSGLNHVVTFAWKDNDDVSHTDTMTVTDGRNGTDGTNGTDGVGITSIEKTSTVGLVDTYTITLTNGVTQDFTVTNGKDGTGGSVAEMTDVTITGVSDGQILRYNATTHKWENASLANVARTGDYNDLINLPTLGTAAEKNSTNQVAADSTDLVESGAVHEAIANAVSAVYKPSGDKTVAELISSLLVAANLGNVYNITDSGVTTADFVGGAGQTINSGDSVAIIDAGSGVYMFDLLSGFVDLSGYYTKIETNNAIETEIKKLDVSDSAVAGSYITQVTETDGKISVTREAADAAPAENSNKLVKSGGVYAGLAEKADKVSGATNGNFAGLNASGNLTDSGKKAADFATAQALADEAATRSAMGAKNVFPMDLNTIKALNTTGTWSDNVYSGNGVSYTINSDGTILVDTNGSAATGDAELKLFGQIDVPVLGDYILSSSIAIPTDVYLGLQHSTAGWKDLTNGISEITITFASGNKINQAHAYVKSGATVDNLLIKPMLRLATDSDSTYQPYAKTNQELTAENGALTNQVTDIYEVMGQNGAKNVFPFTLKDLHENAVSATWNGNVAVFNGVTWTFETNDAGYVTAYSANGTASGSSFGGSSVIKFCDRTLSPLLGKKIYDLISSNSYVLSGASADNPYLEVSWYSGTSTWKADEVVHTSKELTPPNDADNCDFFLKVDAGATADNVKYNLMLCLKSMYDVDPTYQPPTKTNQQLTQDSVTWDDLSEVGAVNELVYPYSETTHTSSNITYTDNGDGSITVGTGTTSSGSPGSYVMANNTKDIQRLRGKTVKFLIDCDTVINGNNANVQMAIYDSSNNLLYNYYLHMNGGRDETILTVPSNADHVYIHAWNKRDTTISTAYTVKPMIAPVDYNGPYVPYAKTNKELTDDVGNLFAVSSRNGNVFDITISGGYGGNDGTRALIFGGTFIGMLAYYSNQWNYVGSIATRENQSITASNNSSTGLRLTLGGSADSMNIVPINHGSSHFKIAFVS